MERKFEVEGQTIGVKCSAGTVRTYRNLFARDLIQDMVSLEKELVETKTLSAASAEIAENVVYLMAKEYDDTIPAMNEWLSSFSPYFVFNVVAQVIYMWRENLQTINSSKKKLKKTEREWTAALFLLRAVQLGLTMKDLNEVTVGMVLDMYVEMSNDHVKYAELATQEDMNNF